MRVSRSEVKARVSIQRDRAETGANAMSTSRFGRVPGPAARWAAGRLPPRTGRAGASGAGADAELAGAAPLLAYLRGLGAAPSPASAAPTQVAAGSFHDTDTANYTAEDFRFTTKGNTLYAVELGWPAGDGQWRSG